VVGIIIVTHGKFGEELVRSAEMITGKQEYVSTASFMPGELTENLSKKIRFAFDELEDCEKILVFADIYGGSPFNCVMPILKERQFQCIAGVNLPLLVEAFLNRECMDATQLNEMCMSMYHQTIKDISGIIQCS